MVVVVMEKKFELKHFTSVTEKEMTEVEGGSVSWIVVAFAVAIACGILGGIADGYNKA